MIKVGVRTVARVLAVIGFIFAVVSALDANKGILYTSYRAGGDPFTSESTVTLGDGTVWTHKDTWHLEFKFGLMNCAILWHKIDSPLITGISKTYDYLTTSVVDCDDVQELVNEEGGFSWMDHLPDNLKRATAAGKVLYGLLITAMIIYGIGIISDICTFADDSSRNITIPLTLLAQTIALIFIVSGALNYHHKVLKGPVEDEFTRKPDIGYGLLWSCFAFWALAYVLQIYALGCVPVTIKSEGPMMPENRRNPETSVKNPSDLRVNPTSQNVSSYRSPGNVQSSPKQNQTSLASQDADGAWGKYTFPAASAGKALDDDNPFDSPPVTVITH